VYEFLLAAGALVRVNDAGRDHGQIRAPTTHTIRPGHSNGGLPRTTRISRRWPMGRRSNSHRQSIIPAHGYNATAEFQTDRL
jgi:hypothetical protein